MEFVSINWTYLILSCKKCNFIIKQEKVPLDGKDFQNKELKLLVCQASVTCQSVGGIIISLED